MIYILKFIFVIIVLLSLFLIGFFYKEYKNFIKSKQAEESSLFEKMVISLLYIMTSVLLVLLSAFSAMFLFSQINIIVPW